MKVELAKRLLALEDTAMLQRIAELLPPSKDWWDGLSESEKEAVNEAEADVLAGRVFTQDEINTRMQAWVQR